MSRERQKIIILCEECDTEITRIIHDGITDIACSNCQHMNSRADWNVVRLMDECAFMIREGLMKGDAAILHIDETGKGLDVTILNKENGVVARGTVGDLLTRGFIKPDDLADARVRREPPSIVP